MLTALGTKLTGLLDSDFIIAYVLPTVTGLVLFAIILTLPQGLDALPRRWLALDAVEQLLLSVGALFLVTILGYVLEAFSTPLVRFFEGYNWPQWLADWSRAGQHEAWKQLKEADADQADPPAARSWFPLPAWWARFKQRWAREASPKRALYFYFPTAEEDANVPELRPTRLGNVLAASERYAFALLNLDSVLWWPRLLPLLSEDFRAQTRDARAPMLGLINMCAVLTLVAFAGGAIVLWQGTRWWVFALVFLGGIAAARLCYTAAVSQAVGYGNMIRAAFDLYRHDILEAMGIRVPDNLDDELVLWARLSQWIFSFQAPWHLMQAGDPEWLQAPFYYDRRAPSPPKPLEMTIRFETSRDPGEPQEEKADDPPAE